MSLVARVVRVAAVALLLALTLTPSATASALSGNCVLRGASDAICWGQDYRTNAPARRSWTVPRSGGALGIDGDAGHGCVLGRDRAVRCWGDFGTPSTDPTPVAGVPDALDVAVGVTHACALTVDRRVLCWGSNTLGEAGGPPGQRPSGPTAVRGVSDAVSLTVTDFGGCAVSRAGSAICWGSGSPAAASPAVVPGVTDAVQMVPISEGFCFLRASGEIFCGGGLSGYDQNIRPNPPRAVAGVRDAVSIAMRDHALCAVRRSGGLVCSGDLDVTIDDPGKIGSDDILSMRPVDGIVDARAVAFGRVHVCVLLAAGDVRCAGDPAGFALGRAYPTVPTSAVIVPGLSDVRSLSAGYGHACAVVGDHRTVCWGVGTFGQIGQGVDWAVRHSGRYVPDAASPFPVALAPDAEAVAAGGRASCALRAGGAVSCWGSRITYYSEDWIPDAFDFAGAAQPSMIEGVSPDTVQLSTGGPMTCGVLRDGRVQCWGEGALGDGTESQSSHPPVFVTGLVDAVQVAVSATHACALRRIGAVVCWGPAETGAPPLPSNVEDAAQIAVAESATCVLRRSGRVSCWGLGQASASVDSVEGADLSGLTDAVSITAGAHSVCAVRVGGSVVCWGSDGSQSSPPGTSTPRPVAVEGISEAVSVAVAASGGGCALLADRRVACWGSGFGGLLGDGYMPDGHYPYQPRLLPVPGVSGAGSTDRATERPTVSGPSLVGWRLVCGSGRWAVRPISYAFQWLRDGAPIDGATTSNYTTTNADAGHDVRCQVWARTAGSGVPAVSDAVAVVDPASRGTVPPAPSFLAASARHACVVRSSRVLCLGRGIAGEATVGGLLARSVAADGQFCAVRTDRRVSCWADLASGVGTPSAVDGLTDARQVAVGGSHACAVRGNGVVWCWGKNQAGQLGTGDLVDRTAPGKVDGLTNAVGLAAASDTSCAVRSSGHVVCWGRLPGSGVVVNAIVTIAGVDDAVQVALGTEHACVLRTTGTVACWGRNAHGQLGDGSTTARSEPTAVPGLDHVISIAAGAQRSCAVKEDGSSVCWGEHAAPLGSAADALTPTLVTGTDPVTEAAIGADRTCLLQRPGRRPACVVAG